MSDNKQTIASAFFNDNSSNDSGEIFFILIISRSVFFWSFNSSREIIVGTHPPFFKFIARAIDWLSNPKIITSLIPSKSGVLCFKLLSLVKLIDHLNNGSPTNWLITIIPIIIVWNSNPHVGNSDAIIVVNPSATPAWET